MIAWMLYTSLAGLLVAAAAIAVDRVARLANRATRWVWVGAMAGVLGLAFAASSAPEQAAPRLELSARSANPSTLSAEPVSLMRSLEAGLRAEQRLLLDPLVVGIAAITRRLPASASAFAIGGWLVATGSLTFLFLLVHARFGRARRHWPLADLHGTRVRVAPSTGPVVIGLVRPEIVVPRWMLDRDSRDQRVVIAHEAEHVHARDTLLLTAGWIAVVLMPWNAALWFMLSRLRLAIELDCDARVLRGGVAPRAYGDLLIDLAEQAAPLRLAATALSDDSSHLHQRILAMKPEVHRFAFVRAGVAATFGFASLLAACATALPTDADIEKMDAASAEKTAHQLELIAPKDSTVYTVDGKTVSALVAKAVSSELVSAINVTKAVDGGASRIDITTKKEPDGQPARVAVSGRGGRVGGPADTAGLKLKLNALAASTPVFYVDGVRTDAATFKTLRPADIESVEVIKGAAAAAEYGSEGENGVIIVKTKKK